MISANWISLGNGHVSYFQKNEMYQKMSIDWSEGLDDLSNYMIAAAEYGGPLALIMDARKRFAKMDLSNRRFRIGVFSSSGKKLSDFDFVEGKGAVMFMGWSSMETLVAISKEGYVVVFNLFGKIVNEFDLSVKLNKAEIIECSVWGDGIVVMSKLGQSLQVSLFTCVNSKEFVYTPLASTAGVVLETAEYVDAEVPILVMKRSGAFNETEVDVFFPYKNSLIVVNESYCINMNLTNGPFRKMAASPNGSAICLFTESGGLWVIPSDFSSSNPEFSLLGNKSSSSGNENSLVPSQMVWVGEDAVCLYWDPDVIKKGTQSIVLLVNPDREVQRFNYEGGIYLISELDGMRIFSQDSCEFLQKVPHANLSIFRIGSMKPAAVLYDAYLAFEETNATSITNIRTLEKQTLLIEAVEMCLEAAANEFDPIQQDKLLKAAAYGKSFPQCDGFQHKKFVEMCKHLRVLNAVRKENIGMPITYKQYQALTPRVLVDRLINRYEHLVAFKVCEFLNLKKENVLIHWACAKVCSNESDQDILKSIRSRLAGFEQNVSFAVIAGTAYREGKEDLALELLKSEKLVGEQVPLLLNMNKKKAALSRAIESGDSDLIFLVILQLLNSDSLMEFIAKLKYDEFKVARNFLIHYAKETNESDDHTLLRTILQELNMFSDAGCFLVEMAFQMESTEKKEKKLEEARIKFEQDRIHHEDAKLVDDQIRLCKWHELLEDDFKDHSFEGLSVNQTLSKIVPLSMQKAEEFRSDFKVNPKRYYWTVIRSLAEAGRWNELEKFSQGKQPIGYRPYVETCLLHDQVTEAAKYVDKVSDPFDKVELLCRLGKFSSAIQLANAKRSVEMLQFVARKNHNPETQNTIRVLIEEIIS